MLKQPGHEDDSGLLLVARVRMGTAVPMPPLPVCIHGMEGVTVLYSVIQKQDVQFRHVTSAAIQGVTGGTDQISGGCSLC